jgi:integrase/recombinase XerC
MEPHFGLETQGGDFTRLLDALFLEHSEKTREDYGRDLKAFALWLGAPDSEVAARALISAGPLRGNAMVLHFQDAQEALGLSPATRARRLACLKQLVGKARILGLCSWRIEIKAPRVQSLRDTRGPGMEAVAAILEQAAKEKGPLGSRDRAIVRLLFDLGLRRGEVAGLELKHIERGARPAAWIRRKGDSERTLLSLPRATAAALEDWIEWRGEAAGPLFVRLDGAEAKASLTGRAVHMVVRRLGLACGVRTWPHGLRHTAITHVLDMTNDMRAGQKFAGHKSIATTQIYDDHRQDQAGHLAEGLADDLDRFTRRRA